MSVFHINRSPFNLGACFNIRTGDIEDFPGQDSIPCYKVTVEKGKVRVRAKRTDLQANRRIKDMVKRDPLNDCTFVVIGGGPSGGICAETVRQEGFTGRIVLVSKENNLPYDRVKLTKAMDQSLANMQYRTDAFYEEYGIEVYKGVEATKLDSVGKTVTLNNGFVIKYDKVYVATGSQARKPAIPGADLNNVTVIREFTDAAQVVGAIGPDKHVVCLGLSFISLEAAAYLAKKVAKVTIVGRDSVPLRHSFGPEVGGRIKQLLESEGIEFRLENGIKRCIGNFGAVEAVELNDGTELKCDVCIVGIGSTLNTEFLRDSAIHLNGNGSINTNPYLQSNVPDVYVGGDIANAPVYTIGNQLAQIGHYPLAQYHGHIAGKNMAGNVTEMKAVPYFWTTMFGKSFRYSGHGAAHETQIIGSLEELKFVAIFYDKHGTVCGMASCQRDPIVSQFAELLAQGKQLTRATIAALTDPFEWTKDIQPKCT